MVKEMKDDKAANQDDSQRQCLICGKPILKNYKTDGRQRVTCGDTKCKAERKKLYNREYTRGRERYFKDKIFKLLGDKCVRCGITDKRVLQIDHVNGGGYQERQIFRHQHHFYQHIFSVNGKGYQILCANCNWIKRYEQSEHY